MTTAMHDMSTRPTPPPITAILQLVRGALLPGERRLYEEMGQVIVSILRFRRQLNCTIQPFNRNESARLHRHPTPYSVRKAVTVSREPPAGLTALLSPKAFNICHRRGSTICSATEELPKSLHPMCIAWLHSIICKPI